VTTIKSHGGWSGRQDASNVEWAGLPDYGIDLRPDWC